MNVREIIAAHLRELGADGLYNQDGCDECGCFSNDLFPCDSERCLDCVPAYLHKFSDNSERLLPTKPEMDYEGRCRTCNWLTEDACCLMWQSKNDTLAKKPIRELPSCACGSRPLLPKVEEVPDGS